MKIALVHDYLREYGGAERVVEELKNIFPTADLWVGFVDWQALGPEGRRKFQPGKINTTWLQKIPGIKKLYSPLRILAPRAFADLDLSHYDVIISSSNAYFAKAVRATKTGATHYCYCHTPARSLYGYDTQSSQQKKALVKWGGQLLNHFLRETDFEVAQRVDVFMANSTVVAERIAKFYRRKSVVVYPPVKLVEAAGGAKAAPKVKGGERPKNLQPTFVYVNRLNFAKHPELAVQAAIDLNLHLQIVGSGPMEAELKERAGGRATIEFLGAVDDQTLQKVYAAADYLLYPVVDEDFGMVPIEAMAFGVPVIAHRSGGPTETIIDGETGVFFDELNLASLEKAIQQAQKIKFKRHQIAQHAQQFSAEAFAQKVKKVMEKYAGQRL